MTFKLFGLPIGNYTVISPTHALDKKTGSVVKVEKVLAPVLKKPEPNQIKAPGPSPARKLAQPPQYATIKKEVEVVVGLGSQKIDFTFANADGPAPSTGYLIEVFLSGTDGKLTRVYRESVVDALNDDTLSDGFSDYLVLQVDK